MSFKCIQSCEITTVGNKKCIAVYLKPDFIPVFKINGNEISHNPILLEEPNKTQDYNAISKLSIILNKLCTFMEEQQVKKLEAFNDKELLGVLIDRAKKHEVDVNEKKEKQIKKDIDSTIVQNTLLDIFAFCDNYEDGEENFYTICDKFRDFLGKKIGYELDDAIITQPMLAFEYYEKYFPKIEPYNFQILIEELISVYISFFLGFFRSKKLQQSVLMSV